MYSRYNPPPGRDEESYSRVETRESGPPAAEPAPEPAVQASLPFTRRETGLFSAERKRIGSLLKNLNIHLDSGDILLLLIILFLSMESDDDEIIILLALILLLGR